MRLPLVTGGPRDAPHRQQTLKATIDPICLIHLTRDTANSNKRWLFVSRALPSLPQVGDPEFVCDVMTSKSILAMQRGDLDYARAATEDVVRFAREHNLSQLSYALVNLGDIAIEQGRLDSGRALLEEVACSEGPRSTPGRVALINVAEIASLQGRYGDAASLGRTALAAALDDGDQLYAVWAAFDTAWALAGLGELGRAGPLVGAATAFLQDAGFARSRSDLQCEQAILDALHRRLAPDAVHTLVQQGRVTPLAKALGDALNESPQLSAALPQPRRSN